MFFPNFLFVKNSSNCSVCFNSHFQELTLFIFQCATLSIATAILDYHISRPLSTLFFNFFQLFLLLGIFPTTCTSPSTFCVQIRQAGARAVARRGGAGGARMRGRGRRGWCGSAGSAGGAGAGGTGGAGAGGTGGAARHEARVRGRK